MQTTQGPSQAKTNTQDQLRPQASFWTWMLFWVITLPVGLPLWIIGVLVGVDRLQTAWFSLALAIVELTCGKQDLTRQEATSRPEEFIQEPLNDESLLSIIRCSDGYYQRFVRVIDEMGFARRVDLTPVIPGELAALGLDDNVDCALLYTLSQVNRGIFRESLQGRKTQEAPKDQASDAQPAVADQAPATEDQADQTVTEKRAEPTAEVPVAKADKLQKEAPEKRSPKGSVGKVAFVGEKRFAPKGQKPYTSFVVTLETNAGELVEFNGADLAGRFAGEGAKFKMGDTVRIEPRGKSPVEVVENGKRVTRYRKVFSVSRA